MKLTLTVSILSMLCSHCHTANILAIFPTPSISHQVVFRPIIHELAQRGHHVTVLTTDPAFNSTHSPANLTEIDLHEFYESARRAISKVFDGTTNLKTISAAKFVSQHAIQLFVDQWNSKPVQDAVKGKKFDLVITEATIRVALGVAHHYKTPSVQISSLGAGSKIFSSRGVMKHPMLYPELTRTKIHDMTLWERVMGFIEEFQYKYFLRLEDFENDILKTLFGENTPSVTELVDNADLLLLNVHPIWDNNRPVPPTVVYMGGMHLQSEKELPHDLKSYLDKSENGVIYISFGTNINTTKLLSDKVNVFNKVLSKLPYDVLWKWNSDTMPGKPENVRISKWFPQADLLKHPNMKLFITQGGLQSADEAIAATVPLLAFPMLGDQSYNADFFVKLKIGIRLSFTTVTEEILETSIRKLLDDQSYRENIRRLNTIMNDEPQPKLDRAIWWIEYVLRHGGTKHLRAPSVGVGWIEYLMLDIFSVILLAFISFVTVLMYTLTYALKYLKKSSLKSKVH